MNRHNLSSAHGLYVVYDRDDSRLTRERIYAAKHASGSLIIDIPAGTCRTSFVARAVLDAMGKQTGLEGELRSAESDWAYARAWIGGTAIRDLLVLRAHLLPQSCIGDIVDFALVAGLELTLVAVPQELNRVQREVLRDWGFGEIDLSVLCVTAA